VKVWGGQGGRRSGEARADDGLGRPLQLIRAGVEPLKVGEESGTGEGLAYSTGKRWNGTSRFKT
jgi:hypothetical protein